MSENPCRCAFHRPFKDAQEEAAWRQTHDLHIQTINVIDKLIRDWAEAEARFTAERKESRKTWKRSPFLVGETEEEVEAELARIRADLKRYEAEDALTPGYSRTLGPWPPPDPTATPEGSS